MFLLALCKSNCLCGLLATADTKTRSWGFSMWFLLAIGCPMLTLSRVIFTLKDHMHKVVAQAITNSIMITDDHKAHAPTASVPALNSVGPDAVQVPGAGVFATSSNVDMSIPVGSQHPFRLSHSATDLQGLRNCHKSHYPLSPGS